MVRSEAEAYHEAFSARGWARPDAARCRCRGKGWVLSEVDTWHECPYHKGHRHPEDEGDWPEGEMAPTVEAPAPAPDNCEF